MSNERQGGLTDRRILVVEDEFYLADDLRIALADQGATIVGPVGTIARARRLVDAHVLDFAILDINLRGELIFPIADELRGRGVPFVFATGYDAAVIPDEYQNVERWEKPVDACQLVATIIAG